MISFRNKDLPLPREIEEIYSTHYKSNRDGDTTASSIAQRMESWLHRQIAADVHDGLEQPVSTLELGAGTLNQLPYEPDVGPYDIVEPFVSLFESSPRLSRVRNVYHDISEVPSDMQYDRITSVAVLEHICDLPAVVARCGLLMRQDGVFRAAIPNEGTLLWTLGWKLTTGLEFRIRHGLDYGQLMKHEHVNNAAEIESVLGAFFQIDQCKVFGLSKSLGLYRLLLLQSPESDLCREFAVTADPAT